MNKKKKFGPSRNVFGDNLTKIDMVELENNHEALFHELQQKFTKLEDEVNEKEAVADELQATLQSLTNFSLISFIAQSKSERHRLFGFARISKPMRQIKFGIRGTLLYNAKKSGDENQIAIAKSWSKCANMRLSLMNIIARSQILDTQIRRLKQHIKSYKQKQAYFNTIGQHQCKIIVNTLIGFAKDHEKELGKYAGDDGAGYE
jgi:hypothetical protein